MFRFDLIDCHQRIMLKFALGPLLSSQNSVVKLCIFMVCPQPLYMVHLFEVPLEITDSDIVASYFWVGRPICHGRMANTSYRVDRRACQVKTSILWSLITVGCVTFLIMLLVSRCRFLQVPPHDTAGTTC